MLYCKRKSAVIDWLEGKSNKFAYKMFETYYDDVLLHFKE